MPESVSLVVDIVFESIPLIRGAWRWFWERNLEIEMHGPYTRVSGKKALRIADEGPIFSVSVGEKPSIAAWLDLTLINDRTDRKEHILDIELHLKKKRLWFWRKTLAAAKLEHYRYNSSFSNNTEPLEDIELPPMSGRVTFCVWCEAAIAYPVAKLPKYLELVLEFRLVGPKRRMARLVRKMQHTPKADT